MSDIKLNIQEIMKLLPHRYPFLLVDRIVELQEGKRAVGIKNVTVNEGFFMGHFPGLPVMPGVLIVEALAQVGGIILMRLPQSEGKLAFFAGIDGLRFRKPVFPGDQLRLELELLKMKGTIGKMKAKASVEGQVVADGELMFSLVDREEGGRKIHSTAIVHPTASLGQGVEVGPYSIIGPEVVVGDRTTIGSHVIISKWTSIGQDNRIYSGVTIGNAPQDFEYKGEKTSIIIGHRNIIREFVSIHLASGEGGQTVIGNDNFIMAASHIAHNCRIGNQVVMANLVGLCGHATIEDQVVIGGMAGIHQYVRIGRLAMVGGQAKIIQDVPPFMLVDGIPAQVRGLNSMGLQRRGVSPEALAEIKKAFKLLYQSRLNTAQAITEIKKKLKPLPEINCLTAFLEKSTDRGISKKIEKGEKLEEMEEREARELLLPEIPEIGI